jgi:hypothetical protein
MGRSEVGAEHARDLASIREQAGHSNGFAIPALRRRIALEEEWIDTTYGYSLIFGILIAWCLVMVVALEASPSRLMHWFALAPCGLIVVAWELGFWDTFRSRRRAREVAAACRAAIDAIQKRDAA